MSWDWLPCLIKLLLIRLILLSKLNVKESLPEIRISKIYRQGGVVNLTNIFKLCLVISNISKSKYRYNFQEISVPRYLWQQMKLEYCSLTLLFVRFTFAPCLAKNIPALELPH